ncbi:MAG: hypothetical protein GWP91_08990 [Rhodobacterales bacterium]|nr:hypothetical protein [Rhodobacterales bacterium]
MMRRFALLMLLACQGPEDEPAVSTTNTPPATTTVPQVPPVDCDALPSLPLSFERIRGFTTAEDFAIDIDGYYWATDNSGTVVRIPFEGGKEPISPGFGESAGTVFDKDGFLIIADVLGGSLQRIDPDTGGKERILGGLAYPNGVTVDDDGWIYVAEQDAGQVRRVDPGSGADEVIATGFLNPNGLALSPDHKTLYVGSFGGGTVHAVDLTGASDSAELFGRTPGGGISRGCDGLFEGDECFLPFVGLGQCRDGGAGLACEWFIDSSACATKAAGEACVTSALGQPVDSVCAISLVDGQLFCPKVPAEVIVACEGASQDDGCNAQGLDRTCRESWEGVLVCDTIAWEDAMAQGCEGLSAGDPCVIVDYEGFADGTCGTVYGNFVCDPGFSNGYQTFNGGLDGVAADECGNVYVTEYTVGLVWRFPAEGGEAELAIETGAFWIPNLHWGNGVGGWDARTLFVQDRSSGEMLSVETGVGSAPVAYRP